VLNWQGRVGVSARGPLEALVCRASLPLSNGATSIEITRGTLRVTGQDQGWGDTGYAGVQLRLKYLHEDDTFDEFTAVKITYDHNRNRSGQHHQDFNVGLGLKATSPISVELFVHTPNFPGWVAHASNVRLDIEVEETLTVTDSPDAWKDIRFARDDCVKLLWRRCGSAVLQSQDGDSNWLGHHEVDLSHLSNSGLARQGIVSKSVVPSLSDQQVDRKDVAKQIMSLSTRHPSLSMDQKRNLEKMSRVLENAEKVSNGPTEDSDRRGACDELLAMMSRVLEGLKTHGVMAEFVAASLAEAAANCWTAWEEAVHSVYHVVCPDAVAPSHVMTMELEDWFLGELLSFRRDLGYRALAKAKERAGETDVHFKNFFFSSLHFGLPLLQRMAAKDPSRLNYTMLNLVNMDEVRADLWKEYTPASIVVHIKGLLDSSAYWRGRVVDWLRVHCV